ncbi:MAG: ATP-dependent DNA helicase RecG [Patescibacteria group bacterium]|jgi:ATP-dependent DNA helicase RecG|nr:ATP-dependent DNA helicase RecG [Patescibacteria group bacterium]
MIRLNSPLTELKGVGEKTEKSLKQLGLKQVADLLFFLPFRYEEYNNIKDVSNLEIGQFAQIEGEVSLIEGRRGFRKRIHVTEAMLNSNGENIKVVWFNQPYLTKSIKVGDRLLIRGKVGEGYSGPSFVSPEYKKIDNLKINLDKNVKDIQAVYHLNPSLNQYTIRRLVNDYISLANKIPEWLPKNILKKLNLISLSEAIKKIHNPKNINDIEEAQKRIAFTELFMRQLKSQKIKAELAQRKAPLLKFKKEETNDFINSLPFKLTLAQKRSAWEILQDLERNQPMNRLLEGDVGSGKTVVVAIAILNTFLNKKKSALMVPSEILARQHYLTLKKIFSSYDISIALKTRSFKEGEAKKADLIIGTQSLIQKRADIKDISFVVIDEQHRFGVYQRKKLIDENRNEVDNISPHFLSLTATPIPRSLSLAIYGDLDLSIIDEMPAERKELKTSIVKNNKREDLYNFLNKKIKQGEQAFIVYPLIEESDKSSFKAVEKEYIEITKKYFPNLKCEILHGKVKKKEKEKIMTDFASQKIDILFATTVIEVGIDIPNATIMAIENPERFGLAQLHQLRGRVNRSDKQSYCFLLLNEKKLSSKSLERLKILEKYKNGLSLAKKDLELRGAGEVFSSMQSGFSEISLAKIFNYDIIKLAQTEAKELIENDTNLDNNPLIKRRLGSFEKDYHLE